MWYNLYQSRDTMHYAGLWSLVAILQAHPLLRRAIEFLQSRYDLKQDKPMEVLKLIVNFLQLLFRMPNPSKDLGEHCVKVA